MAKKSNVPESIEKQFNKALFKQGEPVLFTWLGAKKYGYVKEYKKVSWGIQYSILSFGTTYPCGIQIKTYRTSYHVGCILFEETTNYGVSELKKRIDSGPEPLRDTEIFRDAPRSKDESSVSNTSLRGNANNVNRKTKSNTTRPNSVENDVRPSDNGVQQRNTKKRKNVELDTAIERQRNFLSGFVKKD
jgi:hypothetical protein